MSRNIKNGSPLITSASVKEVASRPINPSSQGEFHTKWAAQARKREEDGYSYPPGARNLLLGDKVGEAETHEAGEQHVAVGPRQAHTDEERPDHRPQLVAVRPCSRHQEVLDVLHHLEPQSDHGPVDQAVHEPVELVAGKQKEQNKAGPLVQFLVDRSHDGRTPRLEGVRIHDVLQEGQEVAVGDGRESEADDPAPDHRYSDHGDRLGLELVEAIDYESHWNGGRGQEHQ